jgi:glycosyltransferase involved in cell wall biosynthesis
MPESSNPKVLMAVEQLRRRVPGGIGAYARGLLHGLHECAAVDGAQVDLTLLASRSHGFGPSRADPLTALGVPVITSHLPGVILTRAWDHGWVRVPTGFDMVHSVSLAAPPHHSGLRSVVTVHDLAWRRHPESTTSRGRRWHEAALSRARDSDASLVVTSNFVATDLMDAGVAERRITIVRGGSDHLVPEQTAATEALLTRLGISGPFLLTVSTLEPRKNIGRLLEAYRSIRTSLPEPWPLIIVGPAGWGDAVPDDGGNDGVVLTGEVPDGVLTGLYARARAFAYVPLTEGYGLPPLEAMRLGVPTVVSNEVPSVHDLHQADPAPVLVVDPLQIEDIAQGLWQILTDEGVRADLRVRGEAFARQRTWRTAAEEHIALWRSLG